jgi:hypothetical protein
MTFEDYKEDNIKHALYLANKYYSHLGGLDLTNYKQKVDTYALEILYSLYQDYKAERD